MSIRDLKRKSITLYAKGAITELKRQLENCRTERRRQIIAGRIAKWEQTIGVKDGN